MPPTTMAASPNRNSEYSAVSRSSSQEMGQVGCLGMGRGGPLEGDAFWKNGSEVSKVFEPFLLQGLPPVLRSREDSKDLY